MVKITFNGKTHDGYVTHSRRKIKGVLYRLFIKRELIEDLKATFTMSYMRSIEGGLRKGKGYKTNIESDIPFWEFVDIEFDLLLKHFYLYAHYTQEPTFPELFKSLVQSTVLKQFESVDESVILKSKWLPRHTSSEQFHANNVIYYLMDTKKKLLYIGETGRMHSRFLQGHPAIPDWDYYRFDVLPIELSKSLRLTLERMLIFCFATLLQNSKHTSPVLISEYRLANLKIDQ